MTDPEALEITVARTRHARFRALLDPAHPDFDPGYWPAVRALAAGPWPPAPAPSEAELLRSMTCPHQRLCGCSSPGYDCAQLGRRVAPSECRDCLYGYTPR